MCRIKWPFTLKLISQSGHLYVKYCLFLPWTLSICLTRYSFSEKSFLQSEHLYICLLGQTSKCVSIAFCNCFGPDELFTGATYSQSSQFSFGSGLPAFLQYFLILFSWFSLKEIYSYQFDCKIFFDLVIWSQRLDL